jgi:hypothetical protein
MTSHRWSVSSCVVRAGLVLVLLLTIFSTSRAAQFQFHGVGVLQPGKQGIAGETVNISFAYSTDDWILETDGGDWLRWKPPAPIPLQVQGSLSGNNFQVSPVVSVLAFASFYTTWEFNTGSANATFQGMARKDAPSKNSQFNVALPLSFSAAHQVFVDESAAGGIWTEVGNGYAMGTAHLVDLPNGIFNYDVVTLENFQWELTPIPEPQSICLALLAAMALGGRSLRATPRD